MNKRQRKKQAKQSQQVLVYQYEPQVISQLSAITIDEGHESITVTFARPQVGEIMLGPLHRGRLSIVSSE